MADPQNLLYYGDNLDVLRQHVNEESVDLVYLDPPFNSSATYNVLYREHDDLPAASQIEAFEDTWTWDTPAARAYEEVVERGGPVAVAMGAFQAYFPSSAMLAYLAMMAPRLIELHRVLKPTGSIYLHCDPTASHYLKMLMDATFGVQNFRAEIVWQRSHAHSDTAQGRAAPGRVHDLLLFYTKGKEWTWNPVYTSYSDEYTARRFVHADPSGRRYKDADLTAAKPGGDTGYAWRVKRSKGGAWEADLDDEWETMPKEGWEYLDVRPSQGRYWAYSKGNMRQFAEDEKLHYFSTGTPRLKQYADEMLGISLQDVWTDIPPINSQAQERLGYPTQKPVALLERVVLASSNAGDLVLDPFCGCGTTVAAAQRHERRWIGIDITHLAISLIKHRLADSHGLKSGKDYAVVGEPTDLAGARELAGADPWQFQAWALGLVGARTATSAKKGSDKGIDGRIFFHDEAGGKTKQIILSVKAGKTGSGHVDQLRGVVEKEGAALGALISFQESTKPMRENAAGAGFYTSEAWGTSYPRIQLLSVGDLLAGKAQLEYPHVTGTTFKKAPKAQPNMPEQETLDLG